MLTTTPKTSEKPKTSTVHTASKASLLSATNVPQDLSNRIELSEDALSYPTVEYALEKLKKNGLPDARKNERWKYSSLLRFWQPEFFYPKVPHSKIDNKAQVSSDNSDLPAAMQTAAWQPKDALTLSLHNGRAKLADLKPFDQVTGLEVSSLESFLQPLDTQSRQNYLDKLQSLADIDGLCATTLGLSEEPMVLRITPEFSLKTSLNLLHQHTFNSEPSQTLAQANYCTLIIDVAPQATLNLIEQFLETQGNGMVSHLRLVILGRDARCQHTQLINSHRHQQHINYTQVLQMANSEYVSGCFSMGEGFIRQAIEPKLIEPGTSTQLNGAYLALGQAHHDHRLFVNHDSPHCQSQAFYKGIMGQGATAVFNGRIYIAPQACGSDGSLENRNLLLDANSTVNTKPELEIYNDDVKCSHGATVSQIDPNQLLYLQSRGLCQSEAIRLLMESYLLETLMALPESMQEGLDQWLFQNLHNILSKTPVTTSSLLAKPRNQVSCNQASNANTSSRGANTEGDLS